MSRNEIDDPRPWCLSRSGYRIKTGWDDAESVGTRHSAALQAEGVA